MEGKLQLSVRTFGGARPPAQIAAPFDATAGEILASACDNWNLPSEYDYFLHCERLGSQLPENVTLAQAGVREGDVLIVLPSSVPGLVDSTKRVGVS